MTEGDGLPSLICHRCLYHVEKAHEFKMLCEQSDFVLRQYLSFQSDIQKCELKSKGSKDELSYEENIEVHMNNIRFQVNEINNYISRHMKEEPLENSVTRTPDGSDDLQCESEDSEMNCPTCNKHFGAPDQLSRHVLIHTQEGPFPCDFCEVVEKDKASLRAHWKQDHAGKNSHVCQTCGEFFTSKEELLNHNLHHDKTKPYHCTICQKAFSYRSDLRKHSVIHSGLRPYVCPVCLKGFTRSTNLNKHARLHTGSKPFSCLDCNKLFATRGDLMRHSVIHTGEKPFSCTICSISFNRKDKLTRHEKLHAGGRAHSCPECPTSFTRKEELTKHIQFHHFSPDLNENGSEESVCEETEAVVINVDPMHWAEEQGTDSQQGSGYPTSFSEPLQKIGDEERNFSCDVCFKRFRHKRELVRHSAIHTGYRPHGCSTCGKTFARSDKLKRHIATHLKKKKREIKAAKVPTCSTCFKVLSSKHELRRHIMTHAALKPFQCSLCACSFCRRDKLINHIKLSHPYSLTMNSESQSNS